MLIGYFLLSFLIVGLDQWVKSAIVSAIPLGESHPVLTNVFSLTYLQNTGAAWSIFEGKLAFLPLLPLSLLRPFSILWLKIAVVMYY